MPVSFAMRSFIEKKIKLLARAKLKKTSSISLKPALHGEAENQKFKRVGEI